MYARNKSEIPSSRIDWLTVGIYAACVLLGWLNIFAAVYDPEANQSLFDFSLNAGKQLIWIGSSLVLVIIIMVIDFKFFEAFAYVLWGLFLIALVAVIFLARDVNGAKSWFEIGSIRVQPSEFAKFGTALALAKFMGTAGVKFEQMRTKLICGVLLGVPAVLILLQNDTGSTMVFASFVLVLYREGLPAWVLVLGLVAAAVLILTLIVNKFILFIGIAVIVAFIVFQLRRKTLRNIAAVVGGGLVVVAMILSVDFFVHKVLQKHQRDRIMVLLDDQTDKKGVGWQVLQSKIAIGSGGLMGKGFLQGTQTKFDYVPEQSTDFIFCTIGEEHGWLGSLLVIALFMGLTCRLVFLAERQKDRFARIYGYSVASIIFFHFFINIGMTVGLLPVIGIPLPFFSYGGSSLWSFTILLFIFIKIDAHRTEVLGRNY
ncbi:MAG: Rod shape-determining protein RodA [uncultured Cytophagales bacterium]|uniref:Cell wall polymerase n=1 Tax=uncultured Cytophagales bacterium TaxID=158755 RepID=A0A6J4KNW6_9SPHI|nr:MAG: Rod shape-determining protein RodA [uncultured Cytophagales bacterium]